MNVNGRLLMFMSIKGRFFSGRVRADYEHYCALRSCFSLALIPTPSGLGSPASAQAYPLNYN